MILSENIEGQYDESAVALAKLYEDTMKDVDAIMALVQEFSVSVLKDILEATTNMLLDINRLTWKLWQLIKISDSLKPFTMSTKSTMRIRSLPLMLSIESPISWKVTPCGFYLFQKRK